MLSVIIPVLDDEPALLDTVAALVPAAAEGVVRDVWLVAPRLEGFPAVVADAAGCGVVEAQGGRAAMLAAAAGRARSRWALILEPGMVLAGGWMEEAGDFLAGADGERDAAVFSLAPRGGRGRLSAGLVNWRASLFGRGRADQGLVVATARLAAGGPPPRAVRLASPIIDRRARGAAPTGA